MVKVGIVGKGKWRITAADNENMRIAIFRLLDWYYETTGERPTVVSGHSPDEGADHHAESYARLYGPDPIIKPPKTFDWDGYRERNIEIAEAFDVGYCFSVYNPEEYCYHCHVYGHHPNGGCWTIRYAAKQLGKKVGLTIV